MKAICNRPELAVSTQSLSLVHSAMSGVHPFLSWSRSDSNGASLKGASVEKAWRLTPASQPAIPGSGLPSSTVCMLLSYVPVYSVALSWCLCIANRLIHVITARAAFLSHKLLSLKNKSILFTHRSALCCEPGSFSIGIISILLKYSYCC